MMEHVTFSSQNNKNYCLSLFHFYLSFFVVGVVLKRSAHLWNIIDSLPKKKKLKGRKRN